MRANWHKLLPSLYITWYIFQFSQLLFLTVKIKSHSEVGMQGMQSSSMKTWKKSYIFWILHMFEISLIEPQNILMKNKLKSDFNEKLLKISGCFFKWGQEENIISNYVFGYSFSFKVLRAPCWVAFCSLGCSTPSDFLFGSFNCFCTLVLMMIRRTQWQHLNFSSQLNAPSFNYRRPLCSPPSLSSPPNKIHFP